MFCKNCGSNVKDGASFCPQCGSSISVATPLAGGWNPQGLQTTAYSVETERKASTSSRKFLPVLGIVLAVIAVVAVVTVVGIAVVVKIVAVGANAFRTAEEQLQAEYTIVGDWVSPEDHSLVDVLTNMLAEQGLGDVAGSVVQAMGLDGKGQIGLCFTENGKMYLGVDDVYVSIGSFSYEDMGGNHVMMNYSLDFSAFGFNVPIALSYKARYQVDRDSLTLDLFGEEIDFIKDNP